MCVVTSIAKPRNFIDLLQAADDSDRNDMRDCGAMMGDFCWLSLTILSGSYFLSIATPVNVAVHKNVTTRYPCGTFGSEVSSVSSNDSELDCIPVFILSLHFSWVLPNF